MTKKTQKKKTKWCKKRHIIVRNIANAILYPYAKRKFGVKIEKFKEQGDRQYLIVMNHLTSFDQFFCGMVFKGAVYYVASEDLFANGIVSKFIKWAVAPIPIKKQATDISAVLNCARVAREGGTIALSPEGNRTYGGKTGYMKPSIVGLARVLKLPLAFLRIEGGYGVQPRWSDCIRKGNMRAYVSKVVEPEEYNKLTDDEFYKLITESLYVDEMQDKGIYEHKKLAEYMERAMYVCPNCGLSKFKSKNDLIKCEKCGMTARYLPDKTFECVEGHFDFKNVSDWYDYQCDYINNLDLTKLDDKPLYVEDAIISRVIPYKKRIRLDSKGKIALYKDKIIFTIKKKQYELLMDDIKVATVLGRNKLNIYHLDKLYQVKGGKRFNALKYVNLCYRHKNLTGQEGGEYGGKFLGL